MIPIHLKTPLPEGKLAVLTAMDRVARLTDLPLLGLDISSIASADSKGQLVDILADGKLHDRLVIHMLRGAPHRGDMAEKVEEQLSEFRIGLTEWPGP